MDPASDPSRPRWLYAPSKVPNASHWDVVLDARSPSEFEEDRMLGALSTPVLDDEERAEVGTLYAELAQLDLEPSRQKHYTRASQRYQGVDNQPLDASPLPAHLRQDTDFPDVWHVDLIEHEQAGSASAACSTAIVQLRRGAHGEAR